MSGYISTHLNIHLFCFAQVLAQAYDNPIPGYNTETVGNLRLFEALAEHEFQLEYFNDGNFAKVLHCEPIPCSGRDVDRTSSAAGHMRLY